MNDAPIRAQGGCCYRQCHLAKDPVGHWSLPLPMEMQHRPSSQFLKKRATAAAAAAVAPSGPARSDRAGARRTTCRSSKAGRTPPARRASWDLAWRSPGSPRATPRRPVPDASLLRLLLLLLLLLLMDAPPNEAWDKPPSRHHFHSPRFCCRILRRNAGGDDDPLLQALPPPSLLLAAAAAADGTRRRTRPVPGHVKGLPHEPLVLLLLFVRTGAGFVHFACLLASLLACSRRRACRPS
jgi:hypothetical protein